MSHTKRIIELTEYAPSRFPRDEIPEKIGESIWRYYSKQIAVDFPSPKTNWEWELKAQGWVGHIPLAPDLSISLHPKVQLENLFRMLEYAYKLESFTFLRGMIESKSLEEFYERLASILCKQILDRGRRGFYRTYLSQTEHLPYLCGRLDLQRLMRAPWDVNLLCHYHEHTADIEENQILGWTLRMILRSGMCTERVLPFARRAFRTLQSFTSLVPFSPHDCIGRLYNRLNDDYEPLHALCRFFLDHSGPSHEIGDRPMLPFLVNMAYLYQLFVAEWLTIHLPLDLKLKPQDEVDIDSQGNLHFTIDLVLSDNVTGEVLCVLDTKYKTPEMPSTDDVAKVAAYAEVKGCNKAFLVYPTELEYRIDEKIGYVIIRGMKFSLDGDIEEKGQAFLEELLRSIKGIGSVSGLEI